MDYESFKTFKKESEKCQNKEEKKILWNNLGRSNNNLKELFKLYLYNHINIDLMTIQIQIKKI